MAPLYLLWEIEYRALPRDQWESTVSGTPARGLAPGPRAPISGRTPLSDHLPRSLADRLRSYAPDDPSLAPHCAALADRIARGDVLSASLAGLRDMLIGQDLAPCPCRRRSSAGHRHR
ncbi:hypothetical protein ACFYN3_28445 [Streptomyces lavendulae]|uniref:hypothetical protein n=1 Tax=Streptomyces lavendulae TaxID=1914 RepID=UPI0036B4D23B